MCSHSWVAWVWGIWFGWCEEWVEVRQGGLVESCFVGFVRVMCIEVEMSYNVSPKYD